MLERHPATSPSLVMALMRSSRDRHRSAQCSFRISAVLRGPSSIARVVALPRSPRDIRAPHCDLQTRFAFWRGFSLFTSLHPTPRGARRPVSPGLR